MSEAIMFVDDEENILHSLRRVFKRQNYEVLTCLSGEEALQVLEQKEVQVMITDQVMPGLKGTELLKIVKEKYPLMIRIILSGHSDMEDIIRAINEGEIYRFLKKPEDLTDLVSIVDRAIEQRRMLRKVREVFDLLQQKSSEDGSFGFKTSYGNGMVKVELNDGKHALSQEQVVGILEHVVNQAVSHLDMDMIGGVLARQKGRLTLVADLKSGFQLAFELPIEADHG